MNGPDFQRPVTAKPKDPDSYEFDDEQLEKDYRKMYEKYHEMETVLQENPEIESISNCKEQAPKVNEKDYQDVYKWWKKT